eukprot:6821569-Pyramimonas_sp.AAC.1
MARGVGSALAYLGTYVHHDLYSAARIGDVVKTSWNSLERRWVPSQYCDGLRSGLVWALVRVRAAWGLAGQ